MFSSQLDAAWEKVGRIPGSGSSPICPPSNITPFDPSAAQQFWNPDFGQEGPYDRELLSLSENTKAGIYHRDVYAVVPLYMSSVCVEQCLYCNYRAGNKGVEVKRLRLSDEELLKEVEFLYFEKGFRTIELVYATDPKFRADSICRHVELVRAFLESHGGGIVGLSAEAFEESEYRSLRDAGLEFSVVWQETYDRPRYQELHPGSQKKKSFEYRLDAPERMIAAGLSLGMGVLSGLADWRKDWAMLMEHEAYLRRSYGRSADILGVPRLKPALGAVIQTTEFIPTRPEFLCALAVHNLFAPETLPFVNTREEWDVCLDMAKGGGCLFTFNCSTIPGGYSLGGDGKQFPSGSYDAPVFIPRLEKYGLRPVFEWNLKSIQDHAALNTP